MAGVVGVAAVPAAVAAAEVLHAVELLHAAAAAPVAAGVGLLAIALARRALLQVQLTLGRVGGEGLASTGKVLGMLAVYLALTAALSVGFYALLELFAS